MRRCEGWDHYGGSREPPRLPSNDLSPASWEISQQNTNILYQVQTKTLTFHFLKQQTDKLEERQDMPEKLLDKPRMILKYFQTLPWRYLDLIF